MKEFGTQTIPEGETPTVRLLRSVRGDFLFAGSYAPAGVHKAYMNQYGAVSVEAENGELLGVFPREMEWVEGEPSKWCTGETNIITPYEGDWTLEAFNRKKQER